MRKWIDIITEGEVLPFTGNPRPVDPLAVTQGGANIYKVAPRETDLDHFTRSYLATALWTDEEQIREDGAEADYDSFHVTVIERAVKDCREFQEKAADLLAIAYDGDYDEGKAGHDFWLTRNGHGAGFWDGDLDKIEEGLGDKLTAIAKDMGAYSLYVGDNKVIYGYDGE